MSDRPLGPIDASPSLYDLEGAWRIGHAPMNDTEWARETRLRLEELAQPTIWATGHRPENEREWQLEYTFRELENRRLAEVQQRDLNSANMKEAAQQSAQSAIVRSWALLAIVAAIVLMPGIGMVSGVAAQSFSQFIAPITGIAGTIIGYWFSQQSTSGPSNGHAQDGSGVQKTLDSGFPTLPLS